MNRHMDTMFDKSELPKEAFQDENHLTIQWIERKLMLGFESSREQQQEEPSNIQEILPQDKAQDEESGGTVVHEVVGEKAAAAAAAAEKNSSSTVQQQAKEKPSAAPTTKKSAGSEAEAKKQEGLKAIGQNKSPAKTRKRLSKEFRLERKYPAVIVTKSKHPFLPLFGQDFLYMQAKEAGKYVTHDDCKDIIRVYIKYNQWCLSADKWYPRGSLPKVVTFIQNWHKTRIRCALNADGVDPGEEWFDENEISYDIADWEVDGYGKF